MLPLLPISPPDSPMVGMVVTISPNFSLYRIVVLPAASKPTAKERGTGMEMGAREPPRDQGRGKATTANGDGGKQPERLQVRAVIYLQGLKGSLGGECQLLPPKRARGGRGLGVSGAQEGRASFKSRLQGRNPPFLPVGLGRRELHSTQARSSRSQAPGVALKTATRQRAVARRREGRLGSG